MPENESECLNGMNGKRIPEWNGWQEKKGVYGM